MRRAGAWAAVTALLCGCTPAAQVEDPPSTSSVAPEPSLQGSVLQWRRDAEGRRVQVQLTAAREGVVVTTVELAVDGWTPPPVRDRRTELPVGRPLDLELTLTSPDCAAVPTLVAARVHLAGEVEPHVVPLDDGGLLRRLHEAERADEALLEQVRIEVVSLSEVREREVLRATVRFTRLGGRDAVRVADVGPNTIYAITPAGNLPELAGVGAADLVLDLFPARCDVHALGESYRTSLIDLRIALGDAEPRRFVLAPAESVRPRIESFAVETCRAREP